MNKHSFTNHNIYATAPLWEAGVLVAQRTEGFYKKMLYQMDTGYLEVSLHLHFNVVVKMGSFTHTDYLEPYLNDISLEKLLR